MDSNVNNLKRIDVNVVSFSKLARWRYCLNMSVAFIFDNQNYGLISKLKYSLQIIHEVVLILHLA